MPHIAWPQNDSINVSITDKTELLIFNRDQVDEVNIILDEIEILEWKVLGLEDIIEQKNNTIIISENALNTCHNEILLSNQLIIHSQMMSEEYESDLNLLGIQYEKQIRKSKRNRWIAIGSGVAGLLIGVYIAK